MPRYSFLINEKKKTGAARMIQARNMEEALEIYERIYGYCPCPLAPRKPPSELRQHTRSKEQEQMTTTAVTTEQEIAGVYIANYKAAAKGWQGRFKVSPRTLMLGHSLLTMACRIADNALARGTWRTDKGGLDPDFQNLLGALTNELNEKSGSERIREPSAAARKILEDYYDAPSLPPKAESLPLLIAVDWMITDSEAAGDQLGEDGSLCDSFESLVIEMTKERHRLAKENGHGG